MDSQSNAPASIANVKGFFSGSHRSLMMDILTLYGGFGLTYCRTGATTGFDINNLFHLVSKLLEFSMAVVLPNWFAIDKAKGFRTENPGLCYCLMLSTIASFLALHSTMFLQILVPVTMIAFIGHTKCESGSATILTVVIWAFVAIKAIVLFGQTHIVGLVFLALAVCLYFLVLTKIPLWFKNSFSFGEAAIVVTLYFQCCYSVTVSIVNEQDHNGWNFLLKTAGIIFVGANLVIFLLCLMMQKCHSIVLLWMVLIVSGFVYLVIALHLTGTGLELFNFLVDVFCLHKSIFLLLWWLVLTLFSVLMVYCYGDAAVQPSVSECPLERNDEQEQPGTYNKICKLNKRNSQNMDSYLQLKQQHDKVCQVQQPDDELTYKSDKCICQNSKYVPMVIRKYFHLMILCVFMPGIVYNSEFLYLASSGTAALMVFIEVLHLLQVPPCGLILDQYLNVFKDTQDSGDLILTPIYLLIGVSLPLWMAFQGNGDPCSLQVYAGLISVGVGDSAASVVGRRFGHHKWPNSKKSVEGTSAAILSQFLAVYLLQWMGVPGAVMNIEVFICILLISFMEAFTLQIDNLVVPIFALMLFIAIDRKM